MEKIKVGVIVFDNADLLDITGPIEVFNAVKIGKNSDGLDDLNSLYDSYSLFETFVISTYEQDFITTSDGMKIIPDTTISKIKNPQEFDIYVIPGGKGVQTLRKDKNLIKWLSTAIQESRISLSVCTGAYLVAETGYLDNEIVTTHRRHLDLFQKEFPHLRLANNARYTEGHKVITAGGVSAGIDGALAIVRNLISENDAGKAAELINYPWMG